MSGDRPARQDRTGRGWAARWLPVAGVCWLAAAAGGVWAVAGAVAGADAAWMERSEPPADAASGSGPGDAARDAAGDGGGRAEGGAPASAERGGPRLALARQRLARAIEENARTGERLRRLMDRLEGGDGSGIEEVRAMFRDGVGGGLAGGMGADGERGAEAISDERLQVLRGLVKERLPWLDERLERAEGLRAGASTALLRRLGPRLSSLADLAERDPEAARARAQEMRLGFEVADAIGAWRAARASGEADRVSAARARLREAIAAQVEFRFEYRERELATIAERLATMRAALSEQREGRAALVDEKVEELVRDAALETPGAGGG